MNSFYIINIILGVIQLVSIIIYNITNRKITRSKFKTLKNFENEKIIDIMKNINSYLRVEVLYHVQKKNIGKDSVGKVIYDEMLSYYTKHDYTIIKDFLENNKEKLEKFFTDEIESLSNIHRYMELNNDIDDLNQLSSNIKPNEPMDDITAQLIGEDLFLSE